MACTTDTESIALTVPGGNLSADLIIDPDPANAASVGASGLLVSGENASGWFSISDTLTYASTDAPTFTFTQPGDQSGVYTVGNRFRCTQGSVKYFIITGVSYNAGTALTTVTVYGGTDYTLTASTISAPAYAVAKSPQGFPLDPTKWTETLTDTGDRTQSSPASGTWYNPGTLSITIPIGGWDVWWQADIRCAYSAGQGTWDIFGSLSTVNNAESDPNFTAAFQTGLTVSNGNRIVGNGHRRQCLTLAAKAVYYLIAKTASSGGSSLGFYGSTYSPTMVRALCAYL